MRGRADPYLGQRGVVTARGPRNSDTFRDVTLFLGLQGSRQLLQEEGNAVAKLYSRCSPLRSLCDLRLASGDELVAVVGKELVQWNTPSRRDGAAIRQSFSGQESAAGRCRRGRRRPTCSLGS